MAIQKNFVVKNGIEVNDNLIFADKDQNTVGIGTTITPEKLQVNGGIGATSLVLSGVGTIPTLQSTNGTITTLSSNSGSITTVTGSTLNYNNGYIVSGVVTSLSGSNLNYSGIATVGSLSSGIATVGSLSIGVNQVISSGRQLQNIVSLDSTTTATIEAAIANAPNTFTDLIVTGVSTLGTVQVSSGIITATSGIVTYYGDGTNLTLDGNPDLVSATGIGIGTTGGLVGYGITFLDLKGAGVSTSQYDSSVGIATIFFEGGGGGGAIGIGSTFPGTPLSVELPPSNGDLFFHIDYGRTFIYYDEIVLGVGSSAFWVDSSPFNVGVITALTGGVAFGDGSAIVPSWYFEDDVTTGVFSPVNGEQTFVSTGSSILNINPSGIIVTGVTTSTKANIGAATTFPEDLVVQGDARVTGILTVGTTSIILDGVTGNINAPGTITASGFSGTVTGTATSTTNIPDLSGDVSSSNTVTTLATVNSNVGTFGDGGAIPSITVNAKGLVTGVTTSSLVTGITIADDTSTNATRYVTFTSTTSGTITGEDVSSSKLTYNPSTGTLAATNVNSTSDETLKDGIKTIENAVELVNQLRGVEFTWKETNEQSLGVIAQEVEKVLPELVATGDLKSVNYNGLIGVLIEAVKELSAEVEDLKKKLS